MNALHWSLFVNALLLFCLLAPNIVMLLHSKHFEWKVETKVKDKAWMYSILGLFCMEFLPKMTPKELQDWFKKTVKFLLIPFILFGCAARQEQFVSKQQDTYQVLEINPPKHAYVTLQSMTTKETFRDVFLGKHCSGLKNWSVFQMVDLTRYTFKNQGQVIEDFSYDELKLKFCR
jgi:hypothetical protein